MAAMFIAMPAKARVFVGSSSEGGIPIVRNLHAVLEATGACTVVQWTQIFEPSGYTLQSLLTTASEVDFAVLVATPDDVTTSRGLEAPSARDNVLLEFGLFAGALGLHRTYILVTDETMRLPSDIQGMTQLRYQEREDGDISAALTNPVLQVERQIRRHGLKTQAPAGGAAPTPVQSATQSPDAVARAALHEEIDLLCMNANSQGWRVQKNSPSTLRLRKGRRTLTLVKRHRPEETRLQLRLFTAQLRAAGVRVNSTIRRPVGE